MKYLLILLVLLFSNFYTYAQEPIEIEFENGEKRTFTMLYDNPTVLPKWRVGASLFGFNIIDDGTLSLTLRGEYRINKKLYFEALASFPFTRAIDGELGNNKDDNLYKTMKNFNGIGHFTFVNKVITKNKKLPVDFESSIDGEEVYIIQYPRQVNRGLLLDFGVNNFTHPADYGLSSEIPTSIDGSDRYAILNHRSISFQGGFSYTSGESYGMKTNGVDRRYFRYRRMYVNALYALYNGGAVYYNSTEDGPKSKVSGGYESPNKNNFGLVYGYIQHMGMVNKSQTFWFGVEFAVLPHLSYKFKDTVDRLNNEAITAKGHLTLQFGLSFGSKAKISEK
ncbi:hypothetical protein N9Q47_05630 [Vicingaceae bacterium]|nr:hypothetical protein [Vicingaceae bacterium]